MKYAKDKHADIINEAVTSSMWINHFQAPDIQKKVLVKLDEATRGSIWNVDF